MEECCLGVFFAKAKNNRQITSLKGCSAVFCFYLHVIWCCMCVGEHVCVFVLAFVFPGHEHGWFHVLLGLDEVLVVRLFGFPLGVVHRGASRHAR